MKFIPDELRSEIETRVEKVREEMRGAGLDAVLVAMPSNVYYLTGRVYHGYVYVSREGSPVWLVIKPSVFDADGDVCLIRKPELIPDVLGELGRPLPESIGLEFQDMAYSDVMRLKKVFSGCRFGDASQVLLRARMVKTAYEIDKMRRDGMHQAAVYRRITHCYQEDMTDVEFQIEIERVLRREGCLGCIRTRGARMEINLGSVIYGPNADVPSPYDFTMGGAGTDPSLPVGADGSIMRPGHTVMVDMNGTFNGYQTDMTRVWRIGDIPHDAQRAHDCSRHILRELEAMGRPGVKVSALYEKAMEIVRAEGLEENFMGHLSRAPFIGHGVGIQLNEPPVVNSRCADELKAGMTIALEPKFVIPEVGAVGVENTYEVTPEGLRTLTEFPEEIEEL